MACTSDYAERIAELASGRLDADGAEALVTHVEACAECSRELYAVAALVARGEAARGKAGETEAAAPRPRLRLVRPLLVAAAAAILLVTAFDLLREPAGRGGAHQLAALASTAALPAHESVLRSGAEVSSDWAEAMSEYAEGRYAEAVTRLRACEAAGDERALVQLYLGIALLQLAEYEQASAALTRAAGDSQGLLQERALWFLANTRLMVGDAAGAERAFGELFEIHGTYELNARAKLDALRGRE